ncbi:MAG: hypothetical protein CO095_12535 [Armatimonadetes bacterium CG_4_9_14_3_um_filter_58_7]|nr:MAG: hypothetical protein CO095_12535 [Armatimonadetes bacterium CG_4_9_14_3_um_filter_58_7]
MRSQTILRLPKTRAHRSHMPSLCTEGDWTTAEEEMTQAGTETERTGCLWEGEQLQTELELLWGAFVFRVLKELFW